MTAILRRVVWAWIRLVVVFLVGVFIRVVRAWIRLVVVFLVGVFAQAGCSCEPDRPPTHGHAERRSLPGPQTHQPHRTPRCAGNQDRPRRLDPGDVLGHEHR
jgi:hypothetical protein